MSEVESVKIGYVVRWRGQFGHGVMKEAVVCGLTICDEPHAKYGRAVEEVDWSLVSGCRVVFDLSPICGDKQELKALLEIEPGKRFDKRIGIPSNKQRGLVWAYSDQIEEVVR